jgi:hypothetical protein
VMGESEENVEKYLNKNAISSEFNEFSVEKFEAASAKNIKLRMIAQLHSPLSLHNNRRLYKKSIKSIFKSIKIEIFCILSSADNHFWHTIRTGKVQLSTAQLHWFYSGFFQLFVGLFFSVRLVNEAEVDGELEAESYLGF